MIYGEDRAVLQQGGSVRVKLYDADIRKRLLAAALTGSAIVFSDVDGRDVVYRTASVINDESKVIIACGDNK